MNISLLNLFFLLILLQRFYLGAQPANFDNLESQLPPHPRILLLKNEEEDLKKIIAADKNWKKVHQAIMINSDRIINLPPIENKKIGTRLEDQSKEGLRRLFFLSYAWRMTHDKKYLSRAVKEMEAAAAFEDWNPGHFLDVSDLTLGFSIAYDWLYADLSEASRLLIKNAIVEKGLKASFDTSHNWWLRGELNWSQVCNTAMCYGAIATYEDNPELTKSILNRSIESIGLSMNFYKPDGVFPEGFRYWVNGTNFNVLLIALFEKALKTDFGLSNKPGFLKTASFEENMIGPSGKSFNFSDSDLYTSLKLDPAMFWFANKLNDFSLLWLEKGYLINETEKEFGTNRLLPAVMLFGKGVNLDKVSPPQNKIWVGKGLTPIATMRTSWVNSNAIYLAIKGGSPSNPHAHMDIGSFIMDAGGVRWAADLGREDYFAIESKIKGIKLFDMKKDSQRWDVFRYKNQSHSTLTFDNQLQRFEGKGVIQSYSSDPNFLNTILDLTDVYSKFVQNYLRGVAIFDQNTVIVKDEITLLKKGTEVKWNMLTPAEVKIIDKQTAELSQEGKKLILKVISPIGIELKTSKAQSPNAFDSPNPGMNFIYFLTKSEENKQVDCTVILSPGTKSIQLDQVKPLKNWPSKS